MRVYESLEGDSVVNADSPRQNSEWIDVEYLTVVPRHDLEEDPFCSDDAVNWNVVGYLADCNLREA